MAGSLKAALFFCSLFGAWALPNTLATAAALVAQAAEPQASTPEPTILLLEQNLCFQCHRAPAGVEKILRPLAAPNLERIGTRVSPWWLEAWLRDPQSMRPGTRMPHMLAGYAEDQRFQMAADLAAFLMENSAGQQLQLLEVGPDMLRLGETLFREIGCIACHENAFADRKLAQMTSVAALRDFLLDPVAARPSGLMPNMHLTSEEATQLASWLLRSQRQQGPGNMQLLPGWSWRSCAYDGVATTGPVWETAEFLAAGVTTEVHHDFGAKHDRYGVLFDGVLQVPESGEYNFYVASDDGSTLSVDGEMIVDARFHQAHTRRDVRITLTAGAHPIRISYYEAGGDHSLEAGWAGPNFEERPFAALDVLHEGEAFAPLPNPSALGLGDRVRGAQLFKTLNCGSCHPLSNLEQVGPFPAQPFADLPSEGGCLAARPLQGVPYYQFANSARSHLAVAIANPTEISQEFHTEQRVATSLSAMQCTACHQRDGVGAPSAEQMRRFIGLEDLGEEGRVPPSLTGVEAKLQTPWLNKVVTAGSKVRPYMKTRMPAFDAASGASIAADLIANRAPLSMRPAREFDVEQVKMGQEIAGTQGLVCISCHNLAGHPSPGIPGLDLARMNERLEPQWFQRWLRNPHAMRNNTRMPNFWDEAGQSALTRLGDGRADVQIDALWAFLSLGAAMPLPLGLVTNPDRYALIPLQRPLYFGTFMDGLSARVLTVGFPERVHLAFDQHNVRLAKVWRGEFMNAKGTWDGRAGQLESPAGVEVRDLPAGPSFAILSAGQDWPTVSGKEAGWRMRGHRRDEHGNPTFRYHFGTLEVEETLVPQLAVQGAFFHRKLVLYAPEPIVGLQFQSFNARGETKRVGIDFQQVDGRFRAQIEEELQW